MPYNPWAGYRVTGTWADHGSYSAGGIDYPLGYGTPLRAPAAGTLRTSGGSGEYAAGSVGSAGRRSILILDQPLNRILPAAGYPPEAAGPMVAIVVQHQSRFAAAQHYDEGAVIGWSGASANGADYGGDVHLHVHGLDGAGRRVDFTKFITAGGADPTDPGDPGTGDPGDPGTGSGNLTVGADGRLARVASGSGNLTVATDGRLVRASSPTGNLTVASDGRLFIANDH
ncbi:hypothetical protein [Rathayibacter sp. AY2B5]|uniref:hypothetical protein n=1 Tax=Rathayibacter sp. AY2B5 TaxID=2080570 RepID=UPI000CE79928|nr:hypothetical protein [Rathayibacter sp. AY2B5]PPG36340.1 hypothetical protein C5C30_16250 [Rathayibacter sp. AY2B5]